MPTDERIEYERATLKYWTRIYQKSPEAAFEALALKLLSLEREQINTHAFFSGAIAGVRDYAKSLLAKKGARDGND